MENLKIIIIIFLAFGCYNNNVKITKNELKDYIRYIASDKLEGRKAGSEMERKTAEYIAIEYSKFNLKEFNDRYLQNYDFTSGVSLGTSNRLSIANFHLEPGIDFIPLGFSSSSECSGSVIFTGYGIIAEDMNYNDYNNIDVTDKIVMVLRYSPENNNPHGNFTNHEALRKKAMVAREQGSVGMILVDGDPETENTDLKKLRTDKSYSDIGIPVIQITKEKADLWLMDSEINISTIIDSINNNGDPTPVSFDLTNEISIQTALEKTIVSSQNVVGYIPGSGSLSNEYIVVGAHYDHLGWGGEGSGSLDPDAHAIHNGADDNGSGTAAILELAEYFTIQLNDNENRRGIIFIAFGGEEEGLLGSSHFAENPPVKIENIAAMLNLDMVGRMEENKLVVGGTGTSPLWNELLHNLNSDSLQLSFDEEGYGSSDHQSFYLKDIPVLFFFTGAHKDYHRPSDDIDKINFIGLKKITNYVKRITEFLITAENRPGFQKVESERKSRGGFAVYVGTIPDYTYEGKGMRLNGIREKGPGGKAGLKAGDIILKFGKTEILSIYDYMYALQDAKPDVPVEVIIDREGTQLPLTIIPEKKKK